MQKEVVKVKLGLNALSIVPNGLCMISSDKIMINLNK